MHHVQGPILAVVEVNIKDGKGVGQAFDLTVAMLRHHIAMSADDPA